MAYYSALRLRSSGTGSSLARRASSARSTTLRSRTVHHATAVGEPAHRPNAHSTGTRCSRAHASAVDCRTPGGSSSAGPVDGGGARAQHVDHQAVDARRGRDPPALPLRDFAEVPAFASNAISASCPVRTCFRSWGRSDICAGSAQHLAPCATVPRTALYLSLRLDVG